MLDHRRRYEASPTRMRASPSVKVLSAVVLGFFIGISFPVEITPNLRCGIFPCSTDGRANSSFGDSSILGRFWATFRNTSAVGLTHVAANPKGTERLPQGIVVSESDLHLRRLWGAPSEDVPTRKYLLTVGVGYTEKPNVNATVQKFSDNFDVVLFHYDGHTTEWDEFEWSKHAVHVTGRKQTKWWFAKRFLHPSIVAPYEYIFLWDEDLGVENFNADEYLKIVRKHRLEISQPGLELVRGQKASYDVSTRRNGSEVHKTNAGGPGRCTDVHRRPCSGFVEVMAPVFSRDAWRCVWHMIQNDLVHGWGLDFNFWRCVDDPEDHIGVVDTQYVVHHGVPTLIGQGNEEKNRSVANVRARQFAEWRAFNKRIADADDLANSTLVPSDHPQP